MKNDYRPVIHFTAEKNWINDPNGTVYINGEYHLFFQHYPHGNEWGPMYWGHAVSADLLHWEHKPIALSPDSLGYIFSGSAVLDKENVSGFGTAEKPPLVVFYTNHDGDTAKEVQSIAYSTDYENFKKYEKNPVVVSESKKDFRDPKVFYNPVRNGYSMALAAGNEIEFYFSANLKDWEKTGTFEAGIHGFGGTCECPDLLCFDSEEGQKWVLLMSMLLPEDKVGKPLCEGGYFMRHVMQYYIGEFDGDTFRDTVRNEVPLLPDFGPDNYAAVSFSNLEEKIIIGWGENWAYAGDTPSTAFRGKMTLARSLDLIKTEQGFRLSAKPCGLERYRVCGEEIKDGYELETSVFGIRAEGKGKIRLYNENGEELSVEIGNESISLDRSRAGRKDFNEKFAKEECEKFTAPLFTKEGCKAEIIFDTAFIEVFAEDGLIAMSASVYPEKPYSRIGADGDIRLRFYRIE